MLRDIARALASCHASGVVYGDVKPSNMIEEDRSPGGGKIFLSETAATYLIDFGCAQAYQGPLTRRTGTSIQENNNHRRYMCNRINRRKG